MPLECQERQNHPYLVEQKKGFDGDDFSSYLSPKSRVDGNPSQMNKLKKMGKKTLNIFKRKSRPNSLSKTFPDDLTKDPMVDQDRMVDVCGRLFPQSTVKAWKDITLEGELGAGQFGKVYKGFLDLGQYAR